MRVLLDECLPRRLKLDLNAYNVQTVPEAGLAGVKNGKLLASIEGRFECFITIDGNMPYQNKVLGRPYSVVVLHAFSNKYQDLLPLVPELQSVLHNIAPGQVCHIPSQDGR